MTCLFEIILMICLFDMFIDFNEMYYISHVYLICISFIYIYFFHITSMLLLIDL